MPKSFAVRTVIGKKPETSFFIAVQQAAMDGDETRNTEYKLAQESFFDNIDRYWAYHELLVKKPGRANGKMFSQYYEPHKFPFFYDRDRNLIYIGTKKQVVHSFLETSHLIKDWPGVKIDYKTIAPLLPTVTGAWFCELKQAYVSAAGYFGQHVDKSDDFKKAAQLGSISVLYINTTGYDGNEYRVGITSEGSIVLSKNMELEEDEIKLVASVYDKYIAPTLGV
jgi:hypothetical protein